jgi:hypothetical protein
MGFLSKVVSVGTLGLVDGDELFGDQGKGAAKSQAAQNAADREFIAKQVAQARGDIFPLFQSAQDVRGGGTQAALDVLRGSIPEQAQVFQSGNVGAQQALLGGQGNFQRAILGLPQEQQGTQSVGFDTSFFPSSLPSVDPVQQAKLPIAGSLGRKIGEGLDLSRLLSGLFGGRV